VARDLLRNKGQLGYCLLEATRTSQMLYHGPIPAMVYDKATHVKSTISLCMGRLIVYRSSCPICLIGRPIHR
jgi:hypothetical protein